MRKLTRVLAALLALTVLAAACGSDDDDAGPDPTEAPSGDTGEGGDAGDDGAEPAAAAAVAISAVNVATGDVTLTNHGDTDVDLAGWWLCNRPGYVELSGTIAAGGTVTVNEPSLAIGAEAGEVGLYTSNNFGSADAIAGYVTWGTAGGRAGVAEEAGVWSGDAVVPAGDVITSSGQGAASAADWS